MKFLGISRSAIFSPNSENRDQAIFQTVADVLNKEGHIVETMGEDELLHANGLNLTEQFDAVFSMARHEEVLRQLSHEEEKSLFVFNSATALLKASRSALTHLFETAGIPIPPSVALPCAEKDLEEIHFPAWLKRGDACAQTANDVYFLQDKEDLKRALEDFATRHISDAIVCEHIEGDLVKFYGVEGTNFFYLYYPTLSHNFSKFGLEKINGAPSGFSFDKNQLKVCADQAARLSGIRIYGGDCIVRADGSFLLIDFNDWPSYSACTATAAKAIAEMILKDLGHTK